MMPGMNPRAMRQAMKRMGIQQQELDAKEVIIKLEDREIVISNPSVSKINMGGQQTYQVIGEEQERSLDTKPSISEDDVKTVMEQAKCSKEDALKAIEASEGDLAEAILKLQK
jgi:nascent polypeptide-associated complex subunit alpha